MNVYDQLLMEFPGIETTLTSYSSECHATMLLPSLKQALTNYDKERALYCLGEMDNWYQKNLSKIYSNSYVFHKDEHLRVAELIHSAIQKVSEAEATPKTAVNEYEKINTVNSKEPIIFLSHCTTDIYYGNALEKFMTGLGVRKEQLIYSSHPLHKIPLDQNIFNYLRKNINRKIFMIILWSNDYLESPACMNELGAAWVAQCDYTNIYCLLPVTKAQKMLLMVGKGGEGKSRIGLILRELFGSSMYTGSLQKVETNRFARADLEYKLLLVDDDMKTEALPQTNNIKTLVTLEDKIDIERKGQQSVQGTLYVRFACFGNGSLHALYDKSNGFYRRQLLLTTKEKPVGRVDDPFLIDKMRNEKEGILLWALEGLHRLIQNNYQFTISERTAANLKEAMEQGNNILGFLKSEGYFEIRQGAKCKSTDFYKVYERWCLDNLEKPLAASTFIHHLKDNQKSLGIVYDDKCIGTNRGFHNVDVDLFLPVDVPSPWD